MFLADDLAAWLVGVVADAVRSRLTEVALGKPQERALRQAATEAVELTAAELYPAGLAPPGELVPIIDDVFRVRAASDLLTQETLLETLRAGIARQVARLDDLTPGIRLPSLAEWPRPSSAEVAEKLCSHLERQIKVHGSRGGPLTALAQQLNSDALQLDVKRVRLRLDQLPDDLAERVAYDSVGLESDRRREARTWCEQILRRCSVEFLHPIGQDLASIVLSPQSIVLTARAGAGKSVVAAHVVQALLEDRRCHPVLLTKVDVRGGLTAVRVKAGMEPSAQLADYAAAMHVVGHRVLFIVDGLDAMVDDADISTASKLVDELAATSCLVLTCRTELWQQRFADVRIERRQLELLDETFVRAVLREHAPMIPYVPVLRIPIYLDIALKQPAQSIRRPKTETALLEVLWDSYRSPPETLPPTASDFEAIFTALAELQLATMSYEVPDGRLAALLDQRGVNSADLTLLEETGNLWRQAGTARIGHDLLDTFNMARLLTEGRDAGRRRDDVYHRAAEGVGWQTLSLVAQVAHDRNDDHLLREEFTALLMMLDRKRWSDAWMARAWAATYVLLDKISVFMPLVIEVLDGEQVPPVSRDGTGGSRLDPDPAVTQEAASSLASAFAGLHDWQAGLPELAIPVLGRGLQRWQFRKRFVEALARYKSPSALEVILDFAKCQLSQGDDPGLLSEIAEALGTLGRGFAGQERQDCIDVLRDLVAGRNLDPRARRAAITSMNDLADDIVEPVPDVDEAEIITYLNPRDEANQSYSDWRVVHRYVGYACDRIRAGQQSPLLLSALLEAFAHQSLNVREPIARCLGEVDDPAARAALVAELLKPEITMGVRQACLAALNAQIQNAPDSATRALRRWLTLRAAQEAASFSVHVGQNLSKLAFSEEWVSDDLLVTAGAIEVAHAARGAASHSVRQLPHGSSQIPAAGGDLITDEDYALAGRGYEPKYQIVAATKSEDGGLATTLAPTTWEDSAAFHCAMVRQADRLRQNADRLVSDWLAGAMIFPGLASVHCVVITSDKKVVRTLRGSQTLYAAGRWSISFEEQITKVDLESTTHDPATAAARRGFSEEFGVSAASCRVQVISAQVEFPIINLSLVAVMETELSSAALLRAAGHNEEITSVDCFDISRAQLLAEAAHDDLHPTSELRLRVLCRLLDLHGPRADT